MIDASVCADATSETRARGARRLDQKMYDARGASEGASEDEDDDGWEMILVDELRVGVETDVALEAMRAVQAREKVIARGAGAVSMHSRALGVAVTAVGEVERERQPSASAAAERERTTDETEFPRDAEKTNGGSFAARAYTEKTWEPESASATAAEPVPFPGEDEERADIRYCAALFRYTLDFYREKRSQLLQERAAEREEDRDEEFKVFDRALDRFTQVATAACREFRSLAASGADASRARWQRFVRWVARVSRRRQDLAKHPYANVIFVVTVGGVCFIIHRRWLSSALRIEENATRRVHADLSSIEDRFDRCFTDFGGRFSSLL